MKMGKEMYFLVSYVELLWLEKFFICFKIECTFYFWKSLWNHQAIYSHGIWNPIWGNQYLALPHAGEVCASWVLPAWCLHGCLWSSSNASLWSDKWYRHVTNVASQSLGFLPTFYLCFVWCLIYNLALLPRCSPSCHFYLRCMLNFLYSMNLLSEQPLFQWQK